MRSVVRALRMIFIGTILALIKSSILHRIHGVSFWGRLDVCLVRLHRLDILVRKRRIRWLLIQQGQLIIRRYPFLRKFWLLYIYALNEVFDWRVMIGKIEFIFLKVLWWSIEHYCGDWVSFRAILGSLSQLNVVLVKGNRCLVVENFLNVLIGSHVGSGLCSWCRTAKAL